MMTMAFCWNLQSPLDRCVAAFSVCGSARSILLRDQAHCVLHMTLLA